MGLMNEDANARRVTRALVKFHKYSEADATALVEKNVVEVDKGQKLGSMVYYVVDQILKTTEHDCEALDCPDDEIEDEEDPESGE